MTSTVYTVNCHLKFKNIPKEVKSHFGYKHNQEMYNKNTNMKDPQQYQDSDVRKEGREQNWQEQKGSFSFILNIFFLRKKMNIYEANMAKC